MYPYKHSIKFYLSLCFVICLSVSFFIGCSPALTHKGIHKTYYASGQIETLGYYKRGKLHATFTEYYKNGAIKSVKSYKNGLLNGIRRDFRENGTLKSAANYKKNKLEGMRNTYYPGGSLWAKEFYEKGKMIKRLEFDEEGYIISKENYK